MFRYTASKRIGAFSMFMIQEKKNPVLVSLPVSQRGKKLGEMYRALTPQELEKLAVKAKNYKPSAANARRKALRLKRRSQASVSLKLKGAEEYNRFLKVMHERYAKLPDADRFTKLIERFERTYGKPLKVPKKKAAKRSKVTKKAVKKTIKKVAKKTKKAVKPKTHKKKVKTHKKKVKTHKKVRRVKKARHVKKSRKGHAKKALRKKK